MNNIISLKLLQFSKKLGSKKKIVALSETFLNIIQKESSASKTVLRVDTECYPMLEEGDYPYLSFGDLKNITRFVFSTSPSRSFQDDPYFFFNESKNCCFFPLTLESKNIGLLYLENVNEDEDTLKFLNLLCTQSAIYFENVLLLESMEDKIRERAMQLEASKRDITELNQLFKKINSMNSFHNVMEKAMVYIEKRFRFQYFTFGKLSDDRRYGSQILLKAPNYCSDEQLEDLYNSKYVMNRESIFFRNYIKGNNIQVYYVDNNLKLSSEERKFIDLVETKTFLLAPGTYSDNSQYFFGLYSESHLEFTTEEISIISLLSENLVNLYCSIKTNNEIKASIKISEAAKELAVKAQKETERVHEMISTVIQSIDIESLFQKLSIVLKKNYSANSFFIYFINEENNKLLFEKIMGDQVTDDLISELEKQNINLEEKNSIFAEVIRKKKPLFIPRLFPKDISMTEIEIKNLINLEWIYIVPLIYNDKVFGLLNIGTNITGHCNPWVFSEIIKDEYENFIYLLTPSIYNSIQKIKIETAYRELNNSKNELVQKEKFAALGKLIASIAHEINTPLGAIRGNAENLKFSSIDFVEKDLLFIGTLEPQKLYLIQKIILKARAKNALSLKEERTKKKEIKDFLKNMNIENYNEVADILVDSKIYEIEDDLLTLLFSENNIKLLGAIKKLSGFYYKIKNIEHAIDKTSKILTALKSYSSSNSDQSSFKSFSIKESMDKILFLYQSHFLNINIKKNFNEDLPIFFGDQEELMQVWINLILNATQAIENDGIINILLKHDKEYIYVSIIDNGKGIPIEIQEKIFEPFFSTKTDTDSVGLGLHACKNIIERHRGDLTFSSIQGRTEFTIKLPI